MDTLHQETTTVTRLRAPRAVRLGLLLFLLGLAGHAAAQSTVQIAAQSTPGTSTFTYSMTNLVPGNDSITTSAAGVVTVSPTTGTVTDETSAVVITQGANPQYTLTSASCENSTGTTGIGTRIGNSLTIAAANFTPATALVCTFINAQVDADLAISKSASPTTVASGGTVTYTLVASNVGAADVTNAVLSDTPGTGLSCTADASCSAVGGASCPGDLSAAALFGPGTSISSLPAGSSVTLTAACTVTATGQ